MSEGEYIEYWPQVQGYYCFILDLGLPHLAISWLGKAKWIFRLAFYTDRISFSQVKLLIREKNCTICVSMMRLNENLH